MIVPHHPPFVCGKPHRCVGRTL